MKRAFKYIVTLFFCFLTIHQAWAQESFDSELERYERLCSMCLELRTRVESGEAISRDEAKATLDIFVASNKRLKARESEMTFLQRQRFKDISDWFATGVRPVRQENLPLLSLSLPVSAAKGNNERKDLRYSQRIEYECVASETASGKDFVVLAEIAAPDISYGIRAGMTGKIFGGYVSFRSNFINGSSDYECTSDGKLQGGGVFWPGGAETRSDMSASAGLLVKAADWMKLYAGAGYGYRSLLWQDIDGKWAEVADWSRKGLAAELGCIFSVNRLAFSLGASSISFRTCSLTCGIGICF